MGSAGGWPAMVDPGDRINARGAEASSVRSAVGMSVMGVPDLAAIVFVAMMAVTHHAVNRPIPRLTVVAAGWVRGRRTPSAPSEGERR